VQRAESISTTSRSAENHRKLFHQKLRGEHLSIRRWSCPGRSFPAPQILDRRRCGGSFFDFRCGHRHGLGPLLVAAVDRIEKAFSDYLADPRRRARTRPRGALPRSRKPRKRSLANSPIKWRSRMALLRGDSRRCVYGVDLNPFRSNSRASIWIHTFVRGCRSACSITVSSSETR